ncbi:3-deoxy-manno-octulosonate cytidylyltransferase [Nitratifractor sp.]|uniref:3-deoxy-manno-octulosonate cytidylyltransferase n=1 Tax=Nitratifractor sp. TaxID=2268144 RepID=UPI0025F7B219|nr:3-deoxy-manno-octulosonate cytidylyltransferase [Nitratifractor sp.]
MIIIPARIGSSRFPSKVLADILGTPMVIRTAQAVAGLDPVVIATDSREVVELAESYGIRAVMTSESHQSGTDRIYEAASILGLPDDEIILNVQADEPFIEEEVVERVYALTKASAGNPEILASSAYKIVSNPEADDPNLVKVVTDDEGMALYFSRAKIPYPRDHHFDAYKGHLGLYGYTMASLRTYCSLEPSALEQIEKLEQLRILANGYRIAMTEVETESFGIDTPEDLQKVLRKHML